MGNGISPTGLPSSGVQHDQRTNRGSKSGNSLIEVALRSVEAARQPLGTYSLVSRGNGAANPHLSLQGEGRSPQGDESEQNTAERQQTSISTDDLQGASNDEMSGRSLAGGATELSSPASGRFLCRTIAAPNRNNVEREVRRFLESQMIRKSCLD